MSCHGPSFHGAPLPLEDLSQGLQFGSVIVKIGKIGTVVPYRLSLTMGVERITQTYRASIDGYLSYVWKV